MSVMKVVSIVVVTLAVIAGALYYYFSGSMAELDKYIKPMYADLVEQQWSQDAMNKYLCPAAKVWFQNPANAAQIKTMQDTANALGKIKLYGGVNIDDGFNISTSTDKALMAQANVPITFEGGQKILETNLSKVDGKFCLMGFNFLEPKSTSGATQSEQKPAQVSQPAEPAPAPESAVAPAPDQAAPEQQDQAPLPSEEPSKDQQDQSQQSVPADQEPADQQDQGNGQ